MKTNKWNTIVFLCHLSYCIFFFILFWSVFDNNNLFDKYYNLASNCLLATLGINTLGQILAIITKQKFAIRWLIIGLLLFFVTISFTIGQSV